MSLDGVIQAPGGPSEDPTGGFPHGGWLPQFLDEDVGAAIGAVFDRPYDLLLGRRTYDIFAAYWPYVGGEATGIGEVFDRTGQDDGALAAIEMGDAFTRANKYVLSRGHPDLGWSNSHLLPDLAALRGVKEGDGPDMVIQGSSTLYPALLREGLIDELTIMTFPVVIGSGKRLIGADTPPRALSLVDQRTTRSGAIIARYTPAGAVEQGWAGPQSTSAREEARQRAMAEGRW